MIDFCSGRDIDIQALMRMATYAEEAEKTGELIMRNWFDQVAKGSLPTCGTAGCLVGTFAMRERCDWSKWFWNREFAEEKWVASRILIQERFGISANEVDFLFDCKTHGTSRSANRLSGLAAIRRLRKFIYYKCRKAELLEDFPAARRIEGDNSFAVVSQEQLETVGV